MMRRALRSVLTFRDMRSFYTEKIFRDQPSSSAIENAKTALLQYNIMIERGIVPDALTYTSLIQAMGKARLEWQAYKLFSSMVDQGIEPLPETLLALRSATNPSRKRLLNDITDRIEGAVQSTPETLVKDAEDILRAGEANEQERIDSFFKASDLPLMTSSKDDPGKDPIHETLVFGQDDEGDSPSAKGTVSIDHPVHSWNVFSKMSDERRASPKAKGDEAVQLRTKLMLLHREELCIFLTIHKLLRVGTDSELVDRILSNVPSSVITEMLQRRYRYFRAVESTTKVLLENAKAIAEDDKQRIQNGESIEMIHDEHVPHEDAREAHFQGGELLYTPWGAIRKPPTALRAPPKDVVTKRMSDDGWDEVVLRVTSGDTDQIPTTLLRQYAAHYSLPWNRSSPDSLSRAVEWHVANVLPSLVSDRKPPPTLALKLRQQEATGTSSTIENYEALRVIAKRTKNLQVTDGANEINTSIHRANASEALTATKNVQDARRKENMAAAADLKRRATQYTPSDDRLNFGQVLNEKHRELVGRSSQVMVGESVPYIGKSPVADPDVVAPVSRLSSPKSQKRSDKGRVLSSLDGSTTELPPWELDSASQPFNVDTGRFGDPTMGRYMELNDGRLKLMPQHETLKAYNSQAALLPKRDRDELLRHRVHSKEIQRQEVALQEGKEKAHHYRRFKNLVERSNRRVTAEREARGGTVPTKEPRRMKHFLKAGRDKEAIGFQKFQRFTRPQ